MERTTGAPETARFFFVRPAGPADAAQLARLRAASLAEQGYLAEAERDAFAQRATADTARLFREQRLVAWLACAGDVVVGSACAVYFDRLPYPDGTLHADCPASTSSPRTAVPDTPLGSSRRSSRPCARPARGGRSCGRRWERVRCTRGWASSTTRPA